MSVRLMSWVFDHSPATGNDRLVLLSLADEADDDGRNAHPSVRRLANKARIDRATVIRAIVRLEGAGQLLVARPETKGRGRYNRYVVVGGRDPAVVASDVGWPPPELVGEPEEWLQTATNSAGSVEGSVGQAAPGATIPRHSSPGSGTAAHHSSRVESRPGDNPALHPRPFADRDALPPRDPHAAERVRRLRHGRGL